ncbi:MAG: hypothetical protein JSW37_13240, partial [Anaerolineales bacterium]
MQNELDRALDNCLRQLKERRASLQECLARYPEHAEQLHPLLQLAIEVRRLPRPVASPDAYQAGKRRMLQALAARQRQRSAGGTRLARLALAASFAVLLLLAGSWATRSWLDMAVAHPARVNDVSGLVEILESQGGTWRRTSTGDAVSAGDRIRAAPGSTARFAFFDGSTTQLTSEAEVTVVRMSARRGGGSSSIVL